MLVPLALSLRVRQVRASAEDAAFPRSSASTTTSRGRSRPSWVAVASAAGAEGFSEVRSTTAAGRRGRSGKNRSANAGRVGRSGKNRRSVAAAISSEAATGGEDEAEEEEALSEMVRR